MIKAKTKFEIVVVGIIVVAIGYMAFSSRPQQVEAQRTVVIDGDLYRASDLYRSERLTNSKDIRMLFEEKNGLMLVGKGYEGFVPNSDGAGWGGTRLYLYNNNGSEEVMVREKSDIISAIFDKDTENIIYYTKEAIIYKYNISNKKNEKIAIQATSIGEFSPDGTSFLYHKASPGWMFGQYLDEPTSFAVINLSTGKERIIPNTTEPYGYSPIWTPDGKQIIFFGNGITLINIDGTGRTQLTKQGDGIDVYEMRGEPIWSSNGRYFIYNGNDGSEIFLFELDLQNKRIITGGPIAYGTFPRWVEEGKTISVLSPDAKAGEPALSIIDLNGKVLQGDKSHEKNYYLSSKGAFHRVAPKPVPPPPPPEPPQQAPLQILQVSPIINSGIPQKIPTDALKPVTQ